MSIDISASNPQLREQRAVVTPIIANAAVAKTGNGTQPDAKEIVQAPEDSKEKNQANTDSNQQLKPEDVEQALENLNDYAQNLQRQLNFSVDETTNRTVIQVIDPESDEVVREIPSEEILALARAMEQFNDDNKGKILYAQA